MTSLNRFTPAAAFGDKFFGMSAKERVIGIPANSMSGGYSVPDRERAGTRLVSMLADDGGLPQATQTMQDSATATVTAPESKSAAVISAPAPDRSKLLLMVVLGGGFLWWLNKQ